jgi:hypothetical protein
MKPKPVEYEEGMLPTSPHQFGPWGYLVSWSYHSTQNILYSKNVKIKIYKTIIFPAGLYGCKAWSLALGKNID